MCLVSTGVSKISAGPITVYKVLTLSNRPPYYYDLCYDGTYKEGTYRYRHGSNLPRGYRTVSYSYNTTEVARVYGGFLHAYLKKEDAETLKETLINDRHRKFKIVKMTIPKGTEYWVGLDNDICARELYWEYPFEKLERLLKKIFNRK